MEAPEYRRTNWGLLVVDEQSGRDLMWINPDRFFMPASTAKLITVATALGTLTAAYRFTTFVRRSGKIDEHGVLHGDLIVIGSGDPTLGGRTTAAGTIDFREPDHTNGKYGGKVTPEDPRAGLNALAKQVAAAHITSVSGDVIVDDRLFEQSTTVPAASPISVNDNLIDILVQPTDTGRAATIEARPLPSGYAVVSGVETVRQSEDDPEITVTQRGDTIFVAGHISKSVASHLEVLPVERPADFARRLFIDELRQVGVRVSANFRRKNPVERLPNRPSANTLPVVATFESPPFSEVARLILKVSHNTHANELLLLLAARAGKRTLSDGLQIEHNYLARAGIDVSGVALADGAGTSPADRITPRALVQLLKYVKTQPYARDFLRALPVLGIDGTLASAADSQQRARGHVWAKTGTLLEYDVMNRHLDLTSKSLAGYVTTAKGHRLVFAIFANDIPLRYYEDISTHGDALAAIASALYDDN